MSEANKALARELYDKLSAGDLSVIDRQFADNLVDHEELPGLPNTRQGVRQFFEIFRGAFPDLRMSAEDIIAEGDKVVVRAQMQGTQRGEFMGIPATGKRIDLPVIDIMRVQDGKFIEHWGAMDSGMMMQQLGVAGPS
jgi:steroid delta-isomerase-like uncharacterized protein